MVGQFEDRVWSKMVQLLPRDERAEAHAAYKRWKEFKRLEAAHEPISDLLCYQVGERPTYPYYRNPVSCMWIYPPPPLPP